MKTFNQLRPAMVASKLYVGWRPNVQAQQGQRRSKWKGEGGEYVDVRPWRPGDRITQINQKLRAKDASRLYVNLFETSQKLVVTVLVDLSRSMSFGTQWLTKRELATILAGSIFKSAKCTGDLGRLVMFDRKQVFAGHRTLDAGKVLEAAVPRLIVAETGAPAVPGGLANAALRIPRSKSVVCVISDFYRWSEADLEALRNASFRHHVVCFCIHDLREAELPGAPLLPGLPLPGIYNVLGPDGRSRLIVTSKSDRDEHARRFQQRQQELQALLAATPAKWCSFCTAEPLEQLRQHQLSVLQSRRPRGSLDNDRSNHSTWPFPAGASQERSTP